MGGSLSHHNDGELPAACIKGMKPGTLGRNLCLELTTQGASHLPYGDMRELGWGALAKSKL